MKPATRFFRIPKLLSSPALGAALLLLSQLDGFPAEPAEGERAAREIVEALEKLQADPAALRQALEEVRAKTASAAIPVPRIEAPPEGAAETAAQLKSVIGDLGSQLEKAKADLAALEKQIAELRSGLGERIKNDTASAAQIAALGKTLQLLTLFADGTSTPAASAPPVQPETPPAPAPTPAVSAPVPPPAADPAKLAAEAVEYFEKNIRPVLAGNCYSCHGPEKQKAGLRVDSREAMLKGGDGGQAVLVPGEPDKSPLILAIRYDGETKMPPKKKLPAEAISALEEWVKMGAPWPEEKKEAKAAAPDPAKHWAFQPVARPAPPPVREEALSVNPIDHFIQAKLEAAGITPSPEADRRTLIRRVSFDLAGLPPSPEEIAAFEADPAPNAFEAVVERLLASPRYGERWGRHWLDVARYADTKGYVFQEERRYPFSHAYRDYVIRAFNEDLPYDRFLKEQIAADLLPPTEDKRPLAALGFLTLGRRFLNNKHDIIDDRMDVVIRGTQGLTVSCARCHDHKYDPIPTADYYSIYGIFASSTEPAELPLIEEPKPSPVYDDYLKQVGDRQGKADEYLKERHSAFVKETREKAADYLLAAHDARTASGEEAFQTLARDRNLRHQILKKWRSALDEAEKTPEPVLGAWRALAALPADEFTTRAEAALSALADTATSSTAVNPAVYAELTSGTLTGLKDAAERHRKLFASIPPGSASPDPALEGVRQFLEGEKSPGAISEGETWDLMNLEEQARLRNLRLSVDELKATHPGRPPRAHVLAQSAEPFKPFIFKRGGPGNKGKEVPRQYLGIIEGEGRKPYETGGRLEMAEAIASPKNPLTARVMVNRVWMHHFGEGLVRTPGDFGTRGDPPTHPELLDYLAARFMDEGWSVKKLHRWIMLSAAYRRSSAANPEAAKADPANTLLWRYNRRRLDFESMRDALLAASGRLNLEMGGPSVEVVGDPEQNRRSVYGFVERQNLPGTLRMFDFASPDTMTAKRFETTSPQQALFLMNSPFVALQAKAAVRRPEVAAAGEEAERIRTLYSAVLKRAPREEEIGWAAEFLRGESAAAAPAPKPRAWSYGYGSIHPETKTTASFTPFAHWSGEEWRTASEYPHPERGWTTLGKSHAHPGRGPENNIIRRWTAPRDGYIRIEGKVRHQNAQGDGVLARIVSSRLGELGSWAVANSEADAKVERAEVRAGDTIDFAGDMRESEAFDDFNWAPRIRIVEELGPAGVAGGEPDSWNAARDFAGPAPEPLAPLEQYAQALMLSNEFLFVD